MAGYLNYPGIDENLMFPPEVRTAFANSPEVQQSILDLMADSLLASVSSVAPGAVQDIATREFPFSTTNTSFASNAASSVIDGFEITVMGTGRRLEIVFFAPQAYCTTTADRSVGVYLLTAKDGSSDFSPSLFKRRGAQSSPMTDRGNSLHVSWDIQTELETTYKFKVGVATMGVGTSRLEPTTSGDSVYPLTLKARNH